MLYMAPFLHTCGKGIGVNSVKCGKCNTWVHGRCSGLKGKLSAESFDCKNCKGLVMKCGHRRKIF